MIRYREYVTRPNDGLLTTTEVRHLFRISLKMMKHLTPVKTYKSFGRKHPIKLYSLSDVGAFLESQLGIQLMTEADLRRERYRKGLHNKTEEVENDA